MYEELDNDVQTCRDVIEKFLQFHQLAEILGVTHRDVENPPRIGLDDTHDYSPSMGNVRLGWLPQLKNYLELFHKGSYKAWALVHGSIEVGNILIRHEYQVRYGPPFPGAPFKNKIVLVTTVRQGDKVIDTTEVVRGLTFTPRRENK